MKQTLKLFQIGLRQVLKDGMLLVLMPAPFLVGLIFKFAIPVVNSILEERLAFSLLPWYGLVDSMLICLTPMFVAMISAFVILEERDEGIISFYQTTPIEGYSYLFARIGIPIIWAFVTTIIAATIFNISDLAFITIICSSLISSLTGIVLAMMVISIAGNRVEGLAISKLMGFSFLGHAFVWFVPTPYRYFSSFLPSFWIGELIYNRVGLFSVAFGLLTCFFWIAVFTKQFKRKIG